MKQHQYYAVLKAAHVRAIVYFYAQTIALARSSASCVARAQEQTPWGPWRVEAVGRSSPPIDKADCGTLWLSRRSVTEESAIHRGWH